MKFKALSIVFAVLLSFSSAMAFSSDVTVDIIPNDVTVGPFEIADYDILIMNDGDQDTFTISVEGIPEDWNSTDVIQPGLLTGGRINTSKVDELDAMDYNDVRSIFRMRYDYLIAFEYSPGVTIRTIGPPGVTLDNLVDQDPDNVLRMNRLTVFEGSPVRMVVVLWEG